MAGRVVHWSTGEIDKLITIVQRYPVVWKTDHKHYGRRRLRDAAMQKIAVEFGPTKDVKDLSNKWKNLRTVYLRQRKKKLFAKEENVSDDTSGIPTDTRSSDTNNLVEKMNFLTKYVIVKQSTTKRRRSKLPLDANLFDDADEDSDQSSSSTLSSLTTSEQPTNNSLSAEPTVELERNTVDVCLTPPPAAAAAAASSASLRIKPRSSTEDSNVLDILSTALRHIIEHGTRGPVDNNSSVRRPTDDDYDAFGRFVANELRAVQDPYSRDFVRQQISKLLFDAKWCKTDQAQ